MDVVGSFIGLDGFQIAQVAHDGVFVRDPVSAEQIAARAEGEEVKSAGKPGKNTADELASLAWQAVLAGEPDKAIAACERSLALQPGDLVAEINRAHALMYLDRGAEARTIYEAHKADLFPDSKKPWPQVVVEDFAELRKAGREHPLMANIEAALTGTP